MRRPSADPLFAHRAWIGLVQPDGIVVSPAALADAGLAPDPLDAGELDQLRALCGLAPADPRDRESPPAPRFVVADALTRVITDILGCDPAWLVPSPPSLTRVLPEFNAEQLAPTLALANPNADPRHSARPWLCLIKVLPDGFDLDTPHGDHTDAHWVASPIAKLERLLRETDVPLGVLANDREIRVIYAPAGEGAGVMSFPLELLLGPESETVLGALVMLLGRARWLDSTADEPGSSLDKGFLPRILAESRRYQNNVSTRLAEQVLDALWALLRGLQDAHVSSDNALLRDWLPAHADELYGGLLGVLLRLVFLLYAEDRGQLPTEDFYPANYGIRSLYEKLRDDAGHHPDTMDLRHGAWARLLATFRLVHGGGGSHPVKLPPREGALFSPDTHPFLEGRPRGSTFQRGEALEVPAIPDGVVLRVLDKLLRVEREDLSYKTLGVEELGSVYESMMGFTVETTSGRALALKPDDVVIDLDALLKLSGAARDKQLDTLAGTKLTGKSLEALRAATTVDALHDALAKVRSARTPAVVPAGALVLQPTAERRRSGSHYTPRSLTGPIVDKTLAPVLARFGDAPTHEQILSLKVCDPAMGSGAFLVAACRMLGDRLYEAWQRDGGRAKPREISQISPDDDERVVARRLVAQHCLYGVDKNPFAVDLARLSLWLETLAREHPFTFLDHVLRAGDSLVGVTREQVRFLRFEPIAENTQLETLPVAVLDSLKRAAACRAMIRSLALSDDTALKREYLADAEDETRLLRKVGDAMIGTFFAHAKDTDRKKALRTLRERMLEQRSEVDRRDIAHADSDRRGRPPCLPTQETSHTPGQPQGVAPTDHEPARRSGLDAMASVLDEAREGWTLTPFHWELEFPEVFDRENPGFDAIVGNPPFAGKNTITAGGGDCYIDWLKEVHDESHGNADIVAHFFRRAFVQLRSGGTLGLIATNTIAQGDTRSTGLRWICNHGGTIYNAIRRLKWPGLAAVVVSVLHIVKGPHIGVCLLNGLPVDDISAFLFSGSHHSDPVMLQANYGRGFIGAYVLGMGFVFDESATGGEAGTFADMESLVKRDPRNKQCIYPYHGGEDFNTSPNLSPSRYIINFESRSYLEASKWPDLLSIVETKVKPGRSRVTQRDRRDLWWLYATRVPEVHQYLETHRRCIAISAVTSHLAFGFAYPRIVFPHSMALLLLDDFASLGALQSRVHEIWARSFGSTLGDGLRYTPSDCFETFPFPPAWESDAALEAAGKEYDEHRAALMIAHNEGLTATYNRFHDPGEDDASILRLRELHARMDRAVLDAYGWQDLAPTCEFLLDYEDEAEEEGGGGSRRRRKPWRYRWPDAMRDEVLARLLALNAERAAAERAEAEAKKALEAPKPAAKRRKKKDDGEGQGTLGGV